MKTLLASGNHSLWLQDPVMAAGRSVSFVLNNLIHFAEDPFRLNFCGHMTLFSHFALDPFLLARLACQSVQATEPQSRPNEKTRPAH